MSTISPERRSSQCWVLTGLEQRPEPTARWTPADKRSMGSKKPQILIIDDEPHILHVLSLKLRGAGYEVLTAEDGEEGLAAALDHQPDLIITDYQMPFISGMELGVKLKEHEATQHIPAIMLTARGFTIGQEALTRTNIAVVISKPFSPREVLGQVRALLEQTHPSDADVRENP